MKLIRPLVLIGRIGLVSAAIVAVSSATTLGQLLSPGELTKAHDDLEGVANCTSCHTIGGRGVDESKCLGCHEPIRTRIMVASGLHGSFEEPCVVCHKEHLGKNFPLVRFDTTDFDHRKTGYELVAAHERLDCSSCHNTGLVRDTLVLADIAEGSTRQTFLGLSTSCAQCHEEDDPHGNQFAGQNCSECHTAVTWQRPEKFQHDRASFRLKGRHATVPCKRCHPSDVTGTGSTTIRYAGLEYNECIACHSDPHKQAYGATCTTCHSPEGWSRLTSERAFSHRETGYSLVGAHKKLGCRDCHRQPARDDRTIRIEFATGQSARTYPRIVASTCRSCHVDYHAGSFRSEVVEESCDACHSVEDWLPTTYDIERHNRQSRFRLDAAHLSVTCGSCHLKENGTATFIFDDQSCAACHADDNPHGSQFDLRMGEKSCAACHNKIAWNNEVDFDHASTRFALLGAHANLECTSCHRSDGVVDPNVGIDYSGLELTCVSCHIDVDPHVGQFETRDCGECHTTRAFKPVAQGFDHSSARFQLDGAHREIACAACHEQTIAPDGTHFTRYLTGRTQCADCHTTG